MPPSVPSSSHSDSSPSDPLSDTIPSVQLPIDEPISELEEPIRQLKQCPEDELRTTREHLQRALKALRNGAYSALSESTREELLEHLHANLEALNKALAQGDDSSQEDAEVEMTESTTSVLGKVLTALW